MDLPIFEKCKTCIVRASCSSLCEEYRAYIFEKTGIQLKIKKNQLSIPIARTDLERLIRASDLLEVIEEGNAYTMEINLDEFEDT